MNATGDIEKLVSSLTDISNGHKLLSIVIMYIIGLIVTLGIGSSFATIPIIATLFIPLGASLGLSTMALIALVGTASALGDSGSPASDSTLEPAIWVRCGWAGMIIFAIHVSRISYSIIYL